MADDKTSVKQDASNRSRVAKTTATKKSEAAASERGRRPISPDRNDVGSAGPALAALTTDGVGLGTVHRARLMTTLQQTAGNRRIANIFKNTPISSPSRQSVSQGNMRSAELQRLDELLGRRNVPEGEVISLIGRMTPRDKSAVSTIAKYRKLLASALSIVEMSKVVELLPLTLMERLSWISDSAWIKRAIDYELIRPFIVAAPQAQRDALKTPEWMNFFVAVCTNATIMTAVRDLHFDLATTLQWINAETVSARLELAYPDIRPFIVAAPQAQRDALKTPEWMNFFVAVCTNATMETAVTDLGFDLRDKLRWMIAEGAWYTGFKNLILSASGAERTAALSDQPFLLELREYFFWNNFARTVELLGRSAPSAAMLMADPAVIAAYAVAWPASHPAIVGRPPAAAPANLHEEGGFIYFDLITGAVTTDRVRPGTQARMALDNPDPPDNAILVGGYHTHPNVGPDWGPPHPSNGDTRWATRHGVPLLYQGAFPTVAATSMGSTGPARRLHLAGDRGFPGAAGGRAPQSLLDGSYDEL